MICWELNDFHLLVKSFFDGGESVGLQDIRLFPHLDYCEQNCNEQGKTDTEGAQFTKTRGLMAQKHMCKVYFLIFTLFFCDLEKSAWVSQEKKRQLMKKDRGLILWNESGLVLLLLISVPNKSQGAYSDSLMRNCSFP